MPEGSTRKAPRIIPRTKEASREEAIAPTWQFFAAVDQRNTGMTTRSPIVVPAEVHERDVIDTPDVPASATVTIPDVHDEVLVLRDTSSPN